MGIGIIVLDQFGDATKDSTVVLNESITVASGVATPANDDILSIQYLVNASNGQDFLIANNESDSALVNITGQDSDTIKIGRNDGNYNISYTYDADSEATTATFGTRDAVDDFVTWIPVIIIIIAAAIILGLVMRSFGQGRI